MIGHRINASIRNKAGCEIAHRTPLWHGEARDAKHALAEAHDTLAAFVKATVDADTIVLHIIDAKGGKVAATEYAEDFTIAPGASLGQTGLLDAQADHGFSPAQRAAAVDALKARAVAAMPEVAQRVADKLIGDAIKGFFDRERLAQRPLDGRPINVPLPPDVQATLDAERIRKMKDMIEAAPWPSITVDPWPSITVDPWQRPATRPLDDIREAIHQIGMQTYRPPEAIYVTPRQFAAIKDELGLSSNLDASGTFNGVPIYTNKDPDAPPVQIVRAPRTPPLGPNPFIKKFREDLLNTYPAIDQFFKLGLHKL